MISQKQIKELYGENTGDTNITVRWNINKREIGFHSTNGSTRMSNVRRRSQINNSKIQKIQRQNEKWLVFK